MEQYRFQMPLLCYTEEHTMMEIAESINLKLLNPDNIQWNFNENFNYFGDDLTAIKGVLNWLLPCIKSKEDKLRVLDSMVIELNHYKTIGQTPEDIVLATFQKISNLLEAFIEARERIKAEAEPEHEKESVIAEALPPKAEQKQGSIPDEFLTPDAKKVFQKAIDGGLLDENYKPTSLVHSVALKALLAECMKRECKTLHYATIERFWGMRENSIVDARNTAKNKTGTVKGQEVIYKVFTNKSQ